MVAPAAAVIFSGRGYGASNVQATPARTTAVGPLGQAVTNQNAAAMITANADRIPLRTAVRGSDQRGAAGMGVDNISPLASAAAHPSSRTRAWVRANAAAVCRSANIVLALSGEARSAFVGELAGLGESSRS